MMKMSVGICVVPCLVWPQLASGSRPPEPPAPVLPVVGGVIPVSVLPVEPEPGPPVAVVDAVEPLPLPVP